MTGYDFVKQKLAVIAVLFLQKPFSIERLAECLTK